MNRCVSVGVLVLAILLSSCKTVPLEYRPLDQSEDASRSRVQLKTERKALEAEREALAGERRKLAAKQAEADRITSQKAEQQRQAASRDGARKMILEAQLLLSERKPAEARPIIAQLQRLPYFEDDVNVLAKECARQEAISTVVDQPRISDTRAIDEVRDRLTLPDSYGQTSVISPDLDPLEMPKGPMEEILKRRIKAIDLTDASLVDILDALRKTEGLNIISDQALSSDAALTIHAKDVPIYELLSYVSRNMGIAFYLGENMIWVTAAPNPETGPKLETRVYQLRKGYIPGGAASGGGFGDDDDDSTSSSTGTGESNDDLYDALVSFLEDNPDNPEGSKFEIYRNRNLLAIRNTRENLRLAEEIIRRFDEIPLQVLIEARFIEISQGDLFQLGVDLGNGGTDSSGNVTVDPITGAFGDNGATQAAIDSVLGGLQNKQRGNLRLSGTLDSISYNILLKALQEKKSARNLSAPRVTVLNNQPANLRKGRTIQYFRTFRAADVTVNQTTGSTTTDTVNTNAVVDGEAEDLELGIAIGVVPSISSDEQEITLSLDTSIKDLIQFRTENNVQLPETSESELKTVVTVGSGETVVLGGLISSTQGKTVNKVPFLGDLPLIGFLFRNTETTDEPSHLLIFVTATIVDRDGRFTRLPTQP